MEDEDANGRYPGPSPEELTRYRREEALRLAVAAHKSDGYCSTTGILDTASQFLGFVEAVPATTAAPDEEIPF